MNRCKVHPSNNKKIAAMSEATQSVREVGKGKIFGGQIREFHAYLSIFAVEK